MVVCIISAHLSSLSLQAELLGSSEVVDEGVVRGGTHVVDLTLTQLLSSKSTSQPSTLGPLSPIPSLTRWFRLLSCMTYQGWDLSSPSLITSDLFNASKRMASAGGGGSFKAQGQLIVRALNDFMAMVVAVPIRHPGSQGSVPIKPQGQGQGLGQGLGSKSIQNNGGSRSRSSHKVWAALSSYLTWDMSLVHEMRLKRQREEEERSRRSMGAARGPGEGRGGEDEGEVVPSSEPQMDHDGGLNPNANPNPDPNPDLNLPPLPPLPPDHLVALVDHQSRLLTLILNLYSRYFLGASLGPSETSSSIPFMHLLISAASHASCLLILISVP